MSLKPLMVAISLAVGLAMAAPPAPAAAQQDDRFYGRWEQENRSFELQKMWGEEFPPDKNYFDWAPDGTIEHGENNGFYPRPNSHLIWDLGERVIVCDCIEAMGERFGSLEFYELMYGYRRPGAYSLLLKITYCYRPVLDFFTFADLDPEAIWKHVSAREVRPIDNDDRYGDCRMSESKSPIGSGWSIEMWERWVPAVEPDSEAHEDGAKND